MAHQYVWSPDAPPATSVSINREQPPVFHLAALKNKSDLSRAIACAMAISCERDNFAGYLEAFLTVAPEDQFEEVHLSPPTEKQQFVVAYAKDAIFVAFQGTKNLKDIACDMMVNKKTNAKSPGSYHSGIYQRSSAFFGLLGSQILPSLLELIKGKENLKKRIIFCGHSLGGAVAHRVLTRLLLENEHYGLKKVRYSFVP